MIRSKTILLFCLAALCVQAAERVTLEQLQADWAKYNDRMVELTTPLVVCGSFYDSLILAPERLYCPEERALGLADGDSAMYWQIVEQNRAKSICIHCRNNYYDVRTGDRIRSVRARVVGERQLLTGGVIKTHHTHADRLTRPKKDELRIVGANIENYFADLGGYATKRTTPEQQALKTRKVAKALAATHADLFALCEMQTGNKAPRLLLKALGKNYDYIELDMPDMDRIGSCLIYRKDRLRPYSEFISAYGDTASHYHGRMIAQGFEEINTGERFIVSVNHTKSKRPGRGNYDTNMKRMENTDSLLAMLPHAVSRYEDPDLLLLGDYNCYTQEQPIQTIVRGGYKDMLMYFCPDNYSYSYRGEIGYLDRCFASPSMAAQIVRVRPWHVNADWYYQHGAYKMKDKSMHRYSDHDPIIVDVKLKQQ
ncbi:MAG: hypothetical protein K6A36_04765 [Paludibacteraceae bacterium]|nr:hypothetical protein [Paludibacteraceae bacterium]